MLHFTPISLSFLACFGLNVSVFFISSFVAGSSVALEPEILSERVQTNTHTSYVYRTIFNVHFSFWRKVLHFILFVYFLCAMPVPCACSLYVWLWCSAIESYCFVLFVCFAFVCFFALSFVYFRALFKRIYHISSILLLFTSRIRFISHNFTAQKPINSSIIYLSMLISFEAKCCYRQPCRQKPF